MGRMVLIAAAVIIATLLVAPASANAEGQQREAGVVYLPPVHLQVRPPAPDIYILNRDRLEYHRSHRQVDFRQEVIDSVRRLPH